MFSNFIVIVLGVQLLFSTRTNQMKQKYALLTVLAARKQRNINYK